MEVTTRCFVTTCHTRTKKPAVEKRLYSIELWYKKNKQQKGLLIARFSSNRNTTHVNNVNGYTKCLTVPGTAASTTSQAPRRHFVLPFLCKMYYNFLYLFLLIVIFLQYIFLLLLLRSSLFYRLAGTFLFVTYFTFLP